MQGQRPLTLAFKGSTARKPQGCCLRSTPSSQRLGSSADSGALHTPLCVSCHTADLAQVLPVADDTITIRSLDWDRDRCVEAGGGGGGFQPLACVAWHAFVKTLCPFCFAEGGRALSILPCCMQLLGGTSLLPPACQVKVHVP